MTYQEDKDRIEKLAVALITNTDKMTPPMAVHKAVEIFGKNSPYDIDLTSDFSYLTKRVATQTSKDWAPRRIKSVSYDGHQKDLVSDEPVIVDLTGDIYVLITDEKVTIEDTAHGRGYEVVFDKVF